MGWQNNCSSFNVNIKTQLSSCFRKKVAGITEATWRPHSRWIRVFLMSSSKDLQKVHKKSRSCSAGTDNPSSSQAVSVQVQQDGE